MEEELQVKIISFFLADNYDPDPSFCKNIVHGYYVYWYKSVLLATFEIFFYRMLHSFSLWTLVLNFITFKHGYPTLPSHPTGHSFELYDSSKIKKKTIKPPIFI